MRFNFEPHFFVINITLFFFKYSLVLIRAISGLFLKATK